MSKLCSKKADIYPIRELDVEHVTIMDQSDGRIIVQCRMQCWSVCPGLYTYCKKIRRKKTFDQAQELCISVKFLLVLYVFCDIKVISLILTVTCICCSFCRYQVRSNAYGSFHDWVGDKTCLFAYIVESTRLSGWLQKLTVVILHFYAHTAVFLVKRPPFIKPPPLPSPFLLYTEVRECKMKSQLAIVR